MKQFSELDITWMLPLTPKTSAPERTDKGKQVGLFFLLWWGGVCVCLYSDLALRPPPLIFFRLQSGRVF